MFDFSNTEGNVDAGTSVRQGSRMSDWIYKPNLRQVDERDKELAVGRRSNVLDPGLWLLTLSTCAAAELPRSVMIAVDAVRRVDRYIVDTLIDHIGVLLESRTRVLQYILLRRSFAD